MSNTTKADLSLLKSYKSSFDNEKQRYTYNTYNTFSGGYISSCSDKYVQRMKTNLSYHYNFISDAYSKINTWWTNYNNDLECLENGLTNDRASGSGIKEASVRSSVNALPTLTKLNIGSFMTFEERRKKGVKLKKHYSQSAAPISKFDLSTNNKSIALQQHYSQSAIPNKIISKTSKKTNAVVNNNFTATLFALSGVLFTKFMPKTSSNTSSVYYSNGLLMSGAQVYGSNVAGAKVATILDLGLSYVGGIVGGGEAIADGIYTMSASIAYPFIKNYWNLSHDKFTNTKKHGFEISGTEESGSIFEIGNLTEEEIDKVLSTKEIFMADVAKSYKGSLLSNVYDTKFGKWINNNSVLKGNAGEIVKGTASQMGEVTTVVIASKLLGGKPWSIGIVGAVNEMGKGSERAYEYGSDFNTGLKYAYARGAFGFISYFGGAKINAIKIGNMDKLSSGVHIGLDAVTGGQEALFDILTDKIYLRKADGKEYTFQELFEENGGLNNVIARTVTGGLFSFVSETGVLFKSNNKAELNSYINYANDDIHQFALDKEFGQQKINMQNIGETSIFENIIDKFKKTNNPVKNGISNDSVISYTTNHQMVFYDANGKPYLSKGTVNITYGELKKFLDENVDANGYLIDTNFNAPNNYFNKNGTVPNDMANHLLHLLKQYNLSDKTYAKTDIEKHAVDAFNTKIWNYISKYYSSLDNSSVAMDNWVNSNNGLTQEIIENYSPQLLKKFGSYDQVIANIKQSNKNVNFFTKEDFTTLGFPPNVNGFSHNGVNMIVINPTLPKKYANYATQFIENTIFHESTHTLSSNHSLGLTGIKKIGSAGCKGLNEALTETFTQYRDGSLYFSTGLEGSSFTYGINAVVYMDKVGFFSIDEFKNQYFNNGLDNVINMMKNGNESFYGLDDASISKILNLFDNASLSNDVNIQKQSSEEIISIVNSFRKQ